MPVFHVSAGSIKHGTKRRYKIQAPNRNAAIARVRKDMKDPKASVQVTPVGHKNHERY